MAQSVFLTATARFGRGYLICLAGTAIWSTTGIIIRYLNITYGLPPLVLAFWRDLFVALGLAGGLALLRPAALRLPGQQMRFLLAWGLVMAVFNASWTFSVALNGASVATVLAYSSPAFTALLGWRFFKEKLTWLKTGVVLFSMFGCLLVSGAHDPAVWQVNPWGIVVGLGSGMLFAAYSLMGKEADRRQLNPWAGLMAAFGAATAFLLVFNLASAPAANLLWLGSNGLGWLILFLLGVGPTIGGFGLYTLSLSYLPASTANLIATLEPALTAILAYILLGEQFNTAQFLGSALILGSVIVLRLREA